MKYFSCAILSVLLIIIPRASVIASGNTHSNQKSHTKVLDKTAHFVDIKSRGQAAKRQLDKYKLQSSFYASINHLGKSNIFHSGAKIYVTKAIGKTTGWYFYDNMENGINSWTVDTHNDTLVHITTANYSSPSHSWWFGNENSGTYANGNRVDQSLISPTIDLSWVSGPFILAFVENYITEQYKDLCMIDVTTDDGASWTSLRAGESGNSQGWILSQFDISGYEGQLIKIRFHFDTGDSLYNDFPGWFIDDVTIYGDPAEVNGTVYYDINQDKLFDGDEYGLGKFTVSATSNGITIQTQTDADGFYDMYLPSSPVIYSITEELPPGWSITTPVSGSWSIDLSSGDNFDSKDFGNWHSAVPINGYVFADDNQNAIQDSDEIFVPGRGIDVYGGGNYTWVDYYLVTDSTGHFNTAVFEPGTYSVQQDFDDDEIQTVPTEQKYTFDIGSLSDSIPTIVFGTYYPDRNMCSISGKVFNDLNKNGILDSGEVGLGWVHVLLNDGDYDDYTGRDGSYHFDDLQPDRYIVSLQFDEGEDWLQIKPTISYDFRFNKKAIVDTANFAVTPLSTSSSISGFVFNDLDGDGTKDQNEKGLPYWSVSLDGSTIFETHLFVNTITDSSGNFIFGNLCPGNYKIYQGLLSDWIQTLPLNFTPYNVSVAPLASANGLIFGNHYDTTFNVGFRSFIPESLALVRDIKGNLKWKPIKNLYPTQLMFGCSFANTGEPTTMLHVEFSLGISDTLTVVPWGNQTVTGLGWVDITFPGWVNTGDTVSIVGFANLAGKKASQRVKKAIWGTGTRAEPLYIYSAFTKNALPNAVDVLMVMNHSIQVGNLTVPSVLMKRYTYIGKSLYYRGNMHEGPPTCFCYIKPNKPFTRQLSYLTPGYYLTDNKLFSETIALKVNIMLSDREITPSGFGDLIYDEGGDNPLNGKSIRFIADKVDEYMSSNDYVPGSPQCHFPIGFESLDSMKLWQTVRNIDSAFCGPIKVYNWTPGTNPTMSLKPVHPVTEIPYLHIDSSLTIVSKHPSIDEVAVYEPDIYDLPQNYPNPFNPTTTISFTLQQESYVTLKVYNALGQEVATLLNGERLSDGPEDVEFDGSSLPSGMYFYRIQAEGIADPDNSVDAQKFIAVKKMILLR